MGHTRCAVLNATLATTCKNALTNSSWEALTVCDPKWQRPTLATKLRWAHQPRTDQENYQGAGGNPRSITRSVFATCQLAVLLGLQDHHWERACYTCRPMQFFLPHPPTRDQSLRVIKQGSKKLLCHQVHTLLNWFWNQPSASSWLVRHLLQKRQQPRVKVGTITWNIDSETEHWPSNSLGFEVLGGTVSPPPSWRTTVLSTLVVPQSRL